MISRRLLYLDTQRLTSYAWQHGKLQPEGVFEMRPEEYARFTDYLRTHQKSHFQLLANVAEEGHEQETIPFLQGADRKALMRHCHNVIASSYRQLMRGGNTPRPVH